MPAKDHNGKYKLTGREVCPFHRYSTDIKIACEGYDGNSISVIRWKKKHQKEAWQHKYCEKNCTECFFYQALYNRK